MPEDVIIPAPSAGTAVETQPVQPETPSADPVKAAIERGDHVEMNRLMNERKRERTSGQGHRTPPSSAAAAPATPVIAPAPGSGTTSGSPAPPPEAEKPGAEKPGSKEYNFRAIESDRDNWRTKAQEAERRLQEAQRRPAEQARPEPAKPLDIPFNEPRPSLDDFNEFKEWQKADEAWLTKRDTARDREIQTRTRDSLVAADRHRQMAGLATSIREKVDALAKTEGFADLPELYAESQSPYTEEMLEFYAGDEHGALVMHHMILNPGQAQELTMLPRKLQKARLAEIRDSLTRAKPAASTKQTTDAPGPIRRAVTGRTEAPIDPLKAAREDGQKTGDWRKFNALMNERKRQKMGMA